MNVFIVFWHPESQSFNAAMLHKAAEALEQAGNEVEISNLQAMGFDPVSRRANVTAIKDPDYFKQQIEELHATETHDFSEEIEKELAELEWCDLMIWQFPLWWFGLPATYEGAEKR